MECNAIKKMCRNFVVSTGVTFTDGNLVINLPAGNYGDDCRYQILVGQELPAETTINSPVVITIGDDTTTTYPLVNCDCTPVYACLMGSHYCYSVRVQTNIASGVFKLTGKMPYSCYIKVANSLPVPATTTAPAG